MVIAAGLFSNLNNWYIFGLLFSTLESKIQITSIYAKLLWSTLDHLPKYIPPKRSRS